MAIELHAQLLILEGHLAAGGLHFRVFDGGRCTGQRHQGKGGGQRHRQASNTHCCRSSLKKEFGEKRNQSIATEGRSRAIGSIRYIVPSFCTC